MLARLAFFVVVLPLLHVIPAHAAKFQDLPDTTEFTFVNGIARTLTGSIRGVTTGDYDRDGDEDVFVTRFADESIHVKQFVLYKNVSTQGSIRFQVAGNGDNGFPTFLQIVSTKKPAFWSNKTKANSFAAAVTADFNGDGWPDIFVGGSWIDTLSGIPGNPRTHVIDRSLLFINLQDPNVGFVEIGDLAGLTDTTSFCQGAAIADYNKDGRLDIFMANTAEHQASQGPGAPNRLFMGTGFATGRGVQYPVLKDSTAAWQVPADNIPHFAPTAGDFDKDGDLDIYVCLRERLDGQPHDPFTPNQLLRNDGTRFVNVASSYGVDDNGNGYGSCWSDFDNDGDLDLLLTNNEHWDEQIVPGKTREAKLFRNNYPLLNFGTVTVPDFSQPFAKGDNNGGFFFDYDLDRLQDFMIAVEGASEFGNPIVGAGTMLFHQSALNTFGENTVAEGVVACGERIPEGANSTFADFDRDGDLDLFLTQADREGVLGCLSEVGSYVFENRTRTGQIGDPHFLTVRLKGGNRLDGVKALVDGIGSQVFVYAGGTSFMQQVNAGAQDGSTFPMDLTFGLGSAAQVDSVVVRWRTFTGANPFRQKFTGPLEVNQPLLLKINPDTVFVRSDKRVIQDAVNSALPGAVVAVDGKNDDGSPATYHEWVMMKSGVKVVAQPGTGTPTIDGGTLAGQAVGFPDNVSSNTILDGLVIKGGTTQIVHLGPGSGVIKNCTIQSSGTGATMGINVTDGTGAIQNCTIVGPLGYGVKVTGGQPSISNTTISASNGVAVFNAALATMSGLNITSSGAALSLWNSSRGDIVSSTLTGSAEAIRIADSSLLQRCQQQVVASGGTYGIHMTGGIAAIGTGTTLSGSAYGLYISGGSANANGGVSISTLSGTGNAVFASGGYLTFNGATIQNAETGLWVAGGTVTMYTGAIQSCTWGAWVDSNGHLNFGLSEGSFPSVTISGCTTRGAVADATGQLIAEKLRVTGVSNSGWAGVQFMPGSTGGLSWCEVKNASGMNAIGILVESGVQLLGTKVSSISPYVSPSSPGYGTGIEISADSLETVIIDSLATGPWHRTVVQTCYRGISIDDYARPFIRSANVTNHYMYGVQIGPTTIPDLGKSGGGARPGNCNIFGVTASSGKLAGGLFHLGEFSPVKAEKNWWGSNPPPSAKISSFVDYTPALTDSIHLSGAFVEIGSLDASRPVRPPFPTPFSDQVTISFRVKEAVENVEITLYDVCGRRIATSVSGVFPKGDHEAIWRGVNEEGRLVPNGLYFARIKVGSTETSRKLVRAR
jgi:ASPIC/UnbV protein/VCBS repeat protein/flagellar hook capping protein FlgD